jgi:hypothetical protein
MSQTGVFLAKDSLKVYHLCDKSNGKLNLTFFNDSIELCKLNKPEFGFYPEYYEMKLNTEFADNITIFFLIPFGSAVGLLLNIMVIRTIRKHRKTDLKEDFYKFMSANSKFNCLYCLIFLFYPINNCVNRFNELFCSSISTNYIVQYYKIVFIAYFGESFKLCSNITYVLISINRYMLIGRHHSPVLEAISKLEFKHTIRMSILFSFLLNIGHFFRYELNDGFIFSPRIDHNLNVYEIYPQINSISVFFSFNEMVYFVLNYVFFLTLNIIIEVLIVRRLRKELQEKKNQLEHMTIHNMAMHRKLETDHKKLQRAIIMVIVNSVINLVLRFPDFFTFIASSQLFHFNVIYLFFISFSQLLNFMVDISYLSFIMTFTTNCIIFYLFNTRFKQALQFWSHVKKK